LSRSANSSLEKIVAHLFPDSNKPIGVLSEYALSRDHEPRRARREIAVEQMPVEGVYAGWRTCQNGGGTTQSPRLGRMSVHDVRPKPAHFSRQRGKGTRIVGKADPPSQRRYPVYLHSGGTQVYVVSLVWPDETGVEPLIKALRGQPPHERHRLQRGTANVHARDDPHDS
jgi:hypothetical protein